jgi:hypothetical protein
MNDKKIDDLLSDYSQSLGHSRHTGKAIDRKRPLWKPVLVTALGAAAVGAFVMMPRRAEAASMEKMINAFHTTRYWTAQRWFKSGPDGKWIPTETETYLDGTYQIVAPKLKANGLTATIKSGFEYYDFKLCPTILKTRFKETSWSKSNNDPLKQAIAYSKNMKGNLVRKDGLLFKGSEAYSLTISNKLGRNVFQAIVKKDTNLPLQFTMTMERTAQHMDMKWEYRYDRPKEMNSLEPDQTKQIIDVERESKALADTWGSKLSEPGGHTILSSSISKNGTIWIASKVPGDTLSKGWRIISLDDPNYVASTYINLNMFKTEEPLGSVLREVVVSEFVPTYDLSTRPKEVTVRFGSYHTFAGPGSRPPRSSVKVTLTDEAFTIPSYFPTIMFDIDTDFVTNRFWSSRAEARRQKGDYKGAIECYLKCDEIERTHLAFVNPSYRPLRAAAECYEKLGERASAQNLLKKIPPAVQTHF